MAVYDVDSVYAQRFADVVNQKGENAFTVIPFTNLETLREYAQKHQVEILLVSVSVPKEQVEGIHINSVVTLAEGEVVSAYDAYPSVYKYQAVDSVIREVMSCYCERSDEMPFVVMGKRARILGVYSPVGRCLKTSLALTIGQQLVKEGKHFTSAWKNFQGFPFFWKSPVKVISRMCFIFIVKGT